MKQWMLKSCGANLKRISERYGISEILAEVLVKRGLYTWGDMDKYLYPKEEKMYPGEKMKDMNLAVEILQSKIKEGKKICIIGDYDVDGIMSTSILYKGLEQAGASVSWRIPHRVRDGYGIRGYMVEEASAQGIDTIITCDNGISAIEAVQCGKELGMTVIITDHHEVPVDCDTDCEVLPEADAIVDPKQEACDYPYKELCGAGVAYKLIEKLLGGRFSPDLKEELLSFAAIATVCDVVPLTDENRIIVKNGLRILQKTKNIGLKALIKELDFQRDIRSGDLGFRIGPCLNAAGRLEDAATGVELLLETDERKATKLAGELVALNEERKEITVQSVEEAIETIEKNNYKNDKVFLVCLECCNESVAGIVAGRIREKYYRPVMILNRSGDLLKGSGRSIPGYHMQQELNKCKHLLKEFGGHAMAAGFSLFPEDLEELRRKMNENCTLTEDDFIEKVNFDREVALGEVDESVVRELDLLQPVGEKNPGALFAKRKIEVCSVRIFGKENQIGRFLVQDQGGKFTVIDFDIELHMKKTICERYSESVWQEVLMGKCSGCILDIMYVPELNQRYGDVQYRVVDCR